MQKQAYRIGIYREVESGWHGGRIYFENLIRLLREAGCGEVELLVIDKEAPSSPSAPGDGVEVLALQTYIEEVERQAKQLKREQRRAQAKPKPAARKWWSLGKGPSLPETAAAPVLAEAGEGALCRKLQWERLAMERLAREHRLDFVFPMSGFREGSEVPHADWIPDLQHCHLPELFDEDDRAFRDERFRWAGESDLIVFSSEAAREDYRRFFPGAKAELAVWRFCSNPDRRLLASDPLEVVRKYHLPERYYMVANQFWRHKDHLCVIEALRQLREAGIAVPVVFSGALRDYRGTGHIDAFLQTLQAAGLHDSVYLLGFLDRDEQWQLMRAALAVIQPSRFEGWSTVVEDCKAIGQRLILSDLPVHLEQSPPESAYFPVGDAGALAARMRAWIAEGAESWLSTRPTREAEALVRLSEARQLAKRRFLEIVDAAGARRSTPSPAPGR